MNIFRNCVVQYIECYIRRYTTVPLYLAHYTGGKKCPKCRQRIIISRQMECSPRLADERWAHKEARKREVAEVADFLGLKLHSFLVSRH